MANKHLNLLRNNLEKIIESFAENIHIIDIQKITATHTVFIISLNEVVAGLNVYFNSKGTTKITPSRKRLHDLDLGQQIVDHIIEHGEISSLNDVKVSIKKFNKKDFDFYIEYISDCKIKSKDIKKNEISTRFILKSDYDDTLHITFYNNLTMLIQGKPLYLFSESLQFLSELLPQNEYIGALIESCNIEIDIQEIKDELRAKCENSISLFGKHVQNILCSALVLKEVIFISTDYSYLAFPALKGLEAYLIILLGKSKIEVSKAEPMSRCFAGDRSNMYLRPEFKPSDQKLLNAIEKCYNYYKLQRHGLFHIDGIPEGSRIIEKRNEAIEIVDHIFELIESTYKEIIS